MALFKFGAFSSFAQKKGGKIHDVLTFTAKFTEIRCVRHFDVRDKICGIKTQKIGINRKF